MKNTKKRIVPCLDIKNGMVVKGTKFENIVEVASPLDRAKYYESTGAQELVFYDITASTEGRQAFKELIVPILGAISIPLCVGGGIATVADFKAMIDLGVSTVSVNSGMIKTPNLIREIATSFSSDKIVFAMDVKKVGENYHVFSNGGMVDTGIDAIEWAEKGANDGAGELVINSIDTDGIRGGFDLPLLRLILEKVSVPVVASGGAGSKEDFLTLFTQLPEIAAGLGASVFHFDHIVISELLDYLEENNIAV